MDPSDARQAPRGLARPRSSRPDLAQRSRFTLRCAIVACATLFATPVGGDDALHQLSAATGPACRRALSWRPASVRQHGHHASAEPVAAGKRDWGGRPIAAHCLVKGEMHRRTSPQDGKSYAIGFEMRLPNAWNGRFFYQANGGIDGAVAPRAWRRRAAADRGAAAGLCRHQLRRRAQRVQRIPASASTSRRALDYGYQAAAKLTPMAKALIRRGLRQACPTGRDFGGCSNGGRHTFVAMTRMPDEYDGYLAGAPGLSPAAGGDRQPVRRQAVRHRGHEPVRPRAPAFTGAERATLSAARWWRKCDALDGAADGIIQDTDGVPAGLRLRTRRAHLRRGARDGRVPDRRRRRPPIAPIFSGRASTARADVVLRRASLRQRPQQRPTPSFWEFFVPRPIDSARHGDDLGRAAGGSGHLQRPGLRAARRQSTTCCAPWPRRTRPTPSPPSSFMLPVEPTNLLALREPRRQGHRSTTASATPSSRSTTRRVWYRRGCAVGQWRRRVELRALLPRAGHVPLRPAARPPTSSTC